MLYTKPSWLRSIWNSWYSFLSSSIKIEEWWKEANQMRADSKGFIFQLGLYHQLVLLNFDDIRIQSFFWFLTRWLEHRQSSKEPRVVLLQLLRLKLIEQTKIAPVSPTKTPRWRGRGRDILRWVEEGHQREMHSRGRWEESQTDPTRETNRRI